MIAAIVLGGGRSARMGTDKLALELDGATLLARTCSAAAGVAARVVVAGHEQPGLDVEFALEDPPYGGPVAGIVAGLLALDTPPGNDPVDSVVILAGDLANPDAVVDLLAVAQLGKDGVVLVDAEGWRQYLAGRYRLDALRRAVDDVGEVRDLSVRRFLGGLDVAELPAPPSVTADLDTPDQFAQAGRLLYDTP
ncbi:NTP transferase domain-containing protein [Tessaracoccus sp. MC1865]|uniref:molybdenum cofactor guanylyltransferase n=1 Tax=Tessaracoccus sp. MC1865 TaxID=2760310 RepID=UPI00160346AE|nr:NTP transferase domain-containing protein [Tessaracoccus sp. MC1865]MBB1483889.1 NTP transferase domain-containing protein [Tessaracoccus sp. MC1865]QTO36942.1 NTP transferase domain-containing protein [Tessaracoccus sp. MC1865]